MILFSDKGHFSGLHILKYSQEQRMQIGRVALQILLIRRLLGFPRLAEKGKKTKLEYKQQSLLKSKNRGMWEG